MPRFSASTVVPHAGDLIVPGSLGAHALAWLAQLAGAGRVAETLRCRKRNGELILRDVLKQPLFCRTMTSVFGTKKSESTMDHVRRLIETQGRRLDWVAERVGISPSHLSNILAGRRQISAAQALALAEALQVPVEYILQTPSEPMEAGV